MAFVDNMNTCRVSVRKVLLVNDDMGHGWDMEWRYRQKIPTERARRKKDF